MNNLLTRRHINLNKLKIKDIERNLKNNGILMVSPNTYKNIDPSNYSHCNIWGSGYSAAQSSKNSYYTSNSFDIGFSFSYLMELDFNFYFLECASEKLAKLVEVQKKGLKNFVDLKNCEVIFKNLSEEKNNLNYALEHYSELVSFARDFSVAHYLDKNDVYKKTVEILLENDPNYFRQACSSVLSSIVFAKNLGFKNIVLHGVDFGGKYFFDLPEYEKFSEYKPPIEGGYLKQRNNNIFLYEKNYRFADVKPDLNCLRRFIPLVKDYLNSENINLFCANKISPLYKLLPIFC